MGSRRLAVRPRFYEGESLASYARRLAEANHISLMELVGDDISPAKYNKAHPQVLTALQSRTGLSEETLLGMAHSKREPRLGNQGFFGIRHNDPAVCYNCYVNHGIRLLEWDHALINICIRCGSLLAPLRGLKRGYQLPPDGLYTKLFDVRDIVLNSHETSRQTRKSIDRLAFLGKTVARNLCPAWPKSRFPVVREAVTRAHEQLAAHPYRRRVTTAPSVDLSFVVIATCWDLAADHSQKLSALEKSFKVAAARAHTPQTRRR